MVDRDDFGICCRHLGCVCGLCLRCVLCVSSEKCNVLDIKLTCVVCVVNELSDETCRSAAV